MRNHRHTFSLARPLHVLAFAVAVAGALTCAAHAEPLVKMEGGKAKPGVVTEWADEGDKVTLTVKKGTDPQAVADAIKDSVPRVRTKVQAGKVIVSGKPKDELLKALAEVDFGGGDLDALASAELAADDEGSGSSLRAKKAADLDKLFKNKDKLVLGQVVGVSYGEFPEAVLTVKVIGAPKGALASKIRKGKSVKFKAVIAKKGKAVDWSSEKTQTNAGAWYLAKKDRVRILVGKETKGGFEADVVDRQ